MHVEDEEAGENIIVEEFQKGYTLPRYRCKTQYGKSSKLRYFRQNTDEEETDYEQDYWY